MRTDWVFRQAKLLEAGAYPDKQVVLTRRHLQQIVRHFRAPVPIFVEHCPSPVLLGWVQKVWVEGDSLYGLLTLFPEADTLLRRLRVRGLSVGLSPALNTLHEVSVTGNPRVASAQLFAQTKEAQSMTNLPADWNPETPECEIAHESALTERIRALEAQLRQFQAQAQVERWVPEGRIAPVQAPLAEALLMSDDTLAVRFHGQEQSVSALFHQFVESLPKREWLAEAAPVPNNLDPDFNNVEALAFLRQVFPDLNPAEILQQKEGR